MNPRLHALDFSSFQVHARKNSSNFSSGTNKVVRNDSRGIKRVSPLGQLRVRISRLRVVIACLLCCLMPRNPCFLLTGGPVRVDVVLPTLMIRIASTMIDGTQVHKRIVVLFAKEYG